VEAEGQEDQITQVARDLLPSLMIFIRVEEEADHNQKVLKVVLNM